MNQNLKLPNFLILGAQKSGTTTLHGALERHPQVFTAHPKELSFFNKEENFRKGVEWYARFFENWRDEKVAGEGTPSYLWDERVPPRIKRILPTARFIILLRNPVTRAYSAYWYAYIGGGETLTFEEALEAEPQRVQMGDAIRGFSSYVDRGRYVRQLKRYFSLFDRDQFLILIFEEYVRNPREALKQVCNFLEVDCPETYLARAVTVRQNVSRIPRSRLVHKTVPFLLKRIHFLGRVVRYLNLKPGKYPPMQEATRRQLQEIFRQEIEELEELLGRDLSLWKN